MTKSTAALFFFFFYQLVFNLIDGYAQEMPVKSVAPVVVKSNKEFFTEDQTSRIFSLKTIHANPYEPLGSVLEKNSTALIRTYGGAGSLASVSIHGTGSNHTQVNWNGIPLNSPTTGQADLSLIPIGFIQSVEVINGASGSLFGSGTFGGSINLNNEPDWDNRLNLFYAMNSGSYGSFGNMVVAGIGNRKIQYQLSAMTSKSENDFTYKDRYRYQTPAIKNNHNAYRDYGIVQNIYINLNKGNFLEAGVWYQKKMLEIPALMGSLKPGTARQKDSLFRSFIGFNRKTDHSIFSFKSAYFSDQLNYTDRTNPTDSGYSLDSKIATNRFINDVTIRYYFSKKIIGGAGMSFNRINGNSNNYGGKIHENEFALYGNVKAIFKNLIINAGIRKEYYEGINARPQYSAGIRFMADSRLVFRSSFSTKFRKPTFNEKYWRPGGNPDLRPEKGHGGDFTIEWNTIGNKNSLFWLDTRISCFYQTVDNWIQWVLTDSLTPVEYKKVHTGGVESWVEFEFHTGLLKVNGQINYNYNRAEIVNTFDDNELYEGKQLIYTPKNTLRANSEAHYQGFMLGFAVSYSGKRETVETGDPSLQLPAFTLWDLSAGIQKKFKQTTLSLYFQVDNIFNKSYEIIRSYPLPGRTCQLTLSVGLHKSGSEN